MDYFKGEELKVQPKNKHFGFNPSSINYLILSHAHIDHSGNIPALVKQGFKGTIYCTPATFDLCKIMLADSAHIQESDALFINKRRAGSGKPILKPLYSMEDVNNSWQYFKTIPYNIKIELEKNVYLHFTDAGHILGSAVTHLEITENNKKHKLCYTGDLGRYVNKILKAPQPIPQATSIICESTYGNREHVSIKGAEEQLKQAVYETCYAKKGKLIIPAFSIGKTQELVYTLNKFEFEGKLPKIKVFVDSPLAINATQIMKQHEECFSNSIKKFMKKDPDPFGFDQLYYIRDAENSKKINSLKEPCIIISASGMAEAGRVKHHLANNIEDSRNSILIIGYSHPSTLSGRLLQGDQKVSIYGRVYEVNATIYSIDFFSAHADCNELLQFLSAQDHKDLENIFLVHGNHEALQHFGEKP